MECESFLCQRLTEIRRDDDVLSVNQFQNADLILQVRGVLIVTEDYDFEEVLTHDIAVMIKL